jgi:hypothetical protein
MSLGPSPRKQTFSLDIGDQSSPQKILVTVEADDTESQNVNRRLFQSPTPKRVIRRKEKTTTTTVPLKGLTDDEDNISVAPTTPRRRGRPPKSGTPVRSGGSKRAATPTRKTPRQRKTKDAQKDDLPSELSVQDSEATPKASARVGKTTKRKTATPAEGEDTQPALPKKRGRRRKSLVPEEILVLTAENALTSIEVDDVASVAASDTNESIASSLAPPHPSDVAGDEDLWMATLSDPPAPVFRRRRSPRLNMLETRPTHDQHNESSRLSASLADPAETHSELGMEIDGSNTDVETQSMAGESHNGEDRDTVMVSEEFTMISIGSLPSMQANLSMAAVEPQEIGEETSLIINETLESLRQNLDDDAEQANVVIPSPPTAVMEESEETPRRPITSTMFFQPNSPQQPWSRSPRRAKSQPLGRQLAMKSLQADMATKSPGKVNPVVELTSGVADNTSMYEDSFSEIPDIVLEAATPKPARHGTTQESLNPPQSLHEGSALHVNTQSPSNRLLTPDETPSPTPTEDEQEKDMESAAKSVAYSAMRSSPRMAVFSPQRSLGSPSQRSSPHSVKTPDAQASPPQLPSQIEGSGRNVESRRSTDSTRPALSPIVRVGRALQLVTSDPPSPAGRESILGSPFRGSAHMSSPSPSRSRGAIPSEAPEQPSSTKTSDRSWSKAFAPFSQIKNLVLQGAQVFSPRAEPMSTMEDPFGPEPAQQQSPDVDDPEVDADSNEDDAVDSTRADPPSDDEMSWRADNSPAKSLVDDSASRSSTMRARRGSTEALDLTMDHGDEPIEEMEQEDDPMQDEEQDDLWVFEASRPTPGRVQPTPHQEPVLNYGRRSKIPSPWRRSTRSRSAVDEEEPEEFSMLSQLGRDDVSVQSGHRGSNARASKLGDFSSFFSSPALLPEIQSPENTMVMFTRVDGVREQPSIFQQQPLAHEVETFPDLPHTSPQEKAHEGGETPRSVPQKEFRLGTQPRVDLFSPVKAAPAQPAEHSSSPLTPERPQFAQIPQKRNFTPRSRQSGGSLFDLGSIPGSAASLFAAVPPEIFVEPDVSFEQAEESSEESIFANALAKPLPPKNLSPTKSCIRSPLKPKTPGRVVEFTSSTLSPLAQAQARAERRASASPEKAPAVQDAAEVGKENRPGEPAPASPGFSLPSPAAGKSPSTPGSRGRLSQTQWTRDHWSRLDQLLQQRRRGGALQFQLKHQEAIAAARRRKSDVSQVLLGKNVMAQGETMALEQWHLDVVDAFRAEVGGWEEAVLAKRLFALLVGEGRRSRGEVPLRR